ncbi:NAD(P)/FAD-dependent oxidoreductase [Cognatishimia sp.]|uniref:NAD(P)/FAD-dependent oxidoreductase n=1 Tax=Cognatishimia sp. TaxID=2211648 RepID=UPI003516A947|nr:FAD-binding oxidoreductase [Cognatishimia sp.]
MIDFLIIGGGMAGVSTAARIAPLGKTVVLEMEPALGYHASGRSAALYEAQYGEPATVVLNLAGRSFFDEHELLSPRGFMVLSPKDDRAGFDAASATFGCTEMSIKEAQSIVPVLNPDHLGFVGLSHEALDIDTDRMLQIFAKMTRANGGEIHTDQPVTNIERLTDGWRVTTKDRSFEAKTVINAAGAWADQVAKMAGITPIGITPKRRSMARVPAPGGHDLSNWPMMMDVHEKWYAKPDAGKLLISPADEDPQSPHDAWADDMVLAEGIARYQPFVTEEVTRVEHTWAGLRSFAPDKNLVIGPSPEDSSFFWMAGQGGSGIQSAPAYSQYAADLIAGRASDVAEITAAVTPARFGR